MTKPNGWSKYEKLVLSELLDVKNDVRMIKDSLASFNTRLTVVELKSGIWGALAGLVIAIPTAITVVRYLHN